MKAVAAAIPSRFKRRASACAPIARASSLTFRNHPSKHHATGSACALASHWVRRGDAAASGSRPALHNALGQRTFKTEPKADQVAPDQSDLGDGFIAWLKRFLSWDYATARTDASLGTAYVYADATGATRASLPTWAILGEYDNGSANSKGRTEYIWLPTESGNPIPVGIFRNGRLYAISADHLGTPRVMKDDSGKVVWQLPYSAFGDNKPTGPLSVTTNPNQAVTNQPYLLRATTAQELNLRFPGQYFDSESNLNYNYFRSYQATQGRYTQADPIGLDGGLNRFGYVDANPTMGADPRGLIKWKGDMYAGSAGALIGGGVFWFDLKSECVNGKYAYVRVLAWGGGTGVGIRASGSAGGLLFQDGESDIRPEVFSGTFQAFQVGIGAGLTGGYQFIRLGRAFSTPDIEPSPGVGIDASANALIGRSSVRSIEIKPCCP